MHNALHRTLAGHGRVFVKRVATGVFKTFVSCQNVAKILDVVGATNLGSTCLFFHASFAAIVDAFYKLPFELKVEDEFNPVVGSAYLPKATFTPCHPGWPASPNPALKMFSQIRLGNVSLHLLNA